MEHNPDVSEKENRKAAETGTAPHAQTQPRRLGGLNWTEALFLLFLAGLAVLPPIGEPHKQLILITIAAVQLLEGRLAGRLQRREATSMPCC